MMMMMTLSEDNPEDRTNLDIHEFERGEGVFTSLFCHPLSSTVFEFHNYFQITVVLLLSLARSPPAVAFSGPIISPFSLRECMCAGGRARVFA